MRTNFVYTKAMKNVTLSADEHLIERARQLARAEKKSLNDVFRTWLTDYTSRHGSASAVDALFARLDYVKPGRKFTRDEMNKR